MGNRNARKTCLHVEVMEERIALSSLAHAGRRARGRRASIVSDSQAHPGAHRHQHHQCQRRPPGQGLSNFRVQSDCRRMLR